MGKLARFVAVGLLVGPMGCSDAPKVVQGRVVSYDAQTKVLVLEDELSPHRELAFDAAAAQLGASPAPGHLVRIAYHDREGRSVAHRVMTVARQSASHK